MLAGLETALFQPLTYHNKLGTMSASRVEPGVQKQIEAPHVAPIKSTPSYTALSISHQRFILAIVTVAGMLGPLAGNIYLPALPVLSRQFQRTETEINVTVTVFMVIFGFGVSSYFSILILGT